MTLIKTLFAAMFALTLVVASSLEVSAQTTSQALTLVYDPSNGNMKLRNTTLTTGSYQSFQILSVGDGTIGAVSGRPGNIGWLSGAAATLPTSSFPVSNTSPFGLNGLNSEITALNVGSAIGMVLAPGGEWDLGNVAVTGMTAANILARFTTDPDATPGGVSQPGTFLVSYFNGGVASLTTPSAITVVPEPSTYAMMLAGATVGGLMIKRRRKTA